MENMIETFTSKQFGEVRITLINDEPWFFATDVCKALDIGNAPMTTSRLDEDERMTINMLSVKLDDESCDKWYRCFFYNMRLEVERFAHHKYHSGNQPISIRERLHE